MITPNSLTDAQILCFVRSKRDGTATDAIARHLCVVALGLSGPVKTSDANMARDRIAAALNGECGCAECVNARNGATP